MKLILASASPRRKDIFRNLFDKFEIRIPLIEEIPLIYEQPEDFTIRISKSKADSIIEPINSCTDTLIVSCDTIVSIENKIIGKPADFEDAVKIIHQLNGKSHKVISSITLLHLNNFSVSSMTEFTLTYVNFKKLSEKEIFEFLTKFDYTDKAGAYAIQEHGNLIVDSIEGSITNVIGFPLRLFFRMLYTMGILDNMPFKIL